MSWWIDDYPIDYDHIVDPDEPMRPPLSANEKQNDVVQQFIKACVQGDTHTLKGLFRGGSTKFRPSRNAFKWALYGATWMGNVDCVRLLYDNNVDGFMDPESNALAGMHLMNYYGLDYPMPRSPTDPVLQFIPKGKQWPLPRIRSSEAAKELARLLRNDLPAIMEWIRTTGEADITEDEITEDDD